MELIGNTFTSDTQLKSWLETLGEEGNTKEYIWNTFSELSKRIKSEVIPFNRLSTDIKYKLINLAHDLSKELTILISRQIVESLLEIKDLDNCTYKELLTYSKLELKRRIVEIYEVTEEWQKKDIF